jgi:hypothetical protein
MFGRSLTLPATILPLVIGLACKVRGTVGSYAEQRAVALAALDSLHQRFNDGRVDDIYRHASPALRVRPKEELIGNMRETRTRWGKFISGNVVSSACFPNEVRFIVDAKYEQAPAVELLTWAVASNEAYLQDYQIFLGPLDSFPDSANQCRSRQ